ncbi:MAG: geranylgeranylglycerol-phosphate geranylgeranyltransferase [Saprospiraceae bacterium]|nr:geranylgeranylglycerol-phosphate geranylgeranyltransferase [Saprospiraceae bacterium]
MWAFFKLIRWKNILITGATQYFLNYVIIRPGYKIAGLQPSLDTFHFALFVLTTLIITATGFIINDIVDFEIDRVNKPDTMILGKKISISRAKFLYVFWVILGLLVTFYLAYHIDNWSYAIMYPCAIALLLIYSLRLKQLPFIGNLVVALFVGCVNMVILLAEKPGLTALKQASPLLHGRILEIFIGFSIFAFCLTVFREIVKDIEDIEGDRIQGCKTIPILFGVAAAKWIAFFFLFVLILSLSYWGFTQYQFVPIYNTVALIVGIGLPTLFVIYKLWKASSKKDFDFLSVLAKSIMISGQIYMLFFNLNAYVS